MFQDNVEHLTPMDLDNVRAVTDNGITKYITRIATLSQDMQDVVISIFELGGVTKFKLIRHLVDKKSWRYKKAKKIVEICYNKASAFNSEKEVR